MKLKKLTALLFGLFLSIVSLVGISSCSNNPKVSPNVLCLQFNDFLEATKENGSHDEMIDYWFSLASESKTIDYKSLVNVNGIIKVGLLEGTEPFSYMSNNQYSGLMVDMIYRFAKKYQYALNFEGYSSTTGLIGALNAGNIDIGASSTTITDERKKAVLFSDPFINDETGILIRSEDAATIQSIDQLNNKKIGVKAGSMYSSFLQGVTTGNEYLEFGSVAELCLALENKNIDAAVSDYSTFRMGVLYHPTLTNIKTKLFDNFLGVMFRKTTYSTFEELEGKKIAVLNEDIMINSVKDKIPNAEIKIYTAEDWELVRKDLDTGVVDAACTYIDPIRQRNFSLNGFAAISDEVFSFENTIVCQNNEQGQQFINRFNDFVNKNKANNLSNILRRKWINNFSDESPTIPDYSTLPSKNGTLIINVDSGFAPYVFKENNKFVGISVDFLSLFAEQNGFGLTFVTTSGVEAKDVFNDGTTNVYLDFGGYIENDSGFLRSEPYSEPKANFIVRDSYTTKINFFENLAMNFKKTFIVEDRYQIFLNGIATTFIITIASIIIGLILGFLVFILIRNTPKISKIIYKIINFLISGTPAVVLLMICFYIIFKGAEVSGIFVSIFAFSLIFMCSTVSFLTTGFDTLDKGQSEAAFTLGYSRAKTFTKILFPQATKIFLPILKGDIISHIKSTAIVGYIAVIDLTKASELVRSRTFDAFFSLICATILYFLLEYLIIFLLKLIPVDPKKRKSIPVLKGVISHD